MGVVAEKGKEAEAFRPVAWVLDWFGNVVYKGSDVVVDTTSGTLTIDTSGEQEEEEKIVDKNGMVIVERIPTAVWVAGGALVALFLFRR